LTDFNINYSTVRRLELLGGEPFFDSTTFDILKKLIEHNNVDCFVSIVTNGSVHLSADQLSLLNKFTDLNVCISIDGIGPVFEYMRWPAKWPSLLENIKQYQSFAKNVSVSYTISSLNALYYDETVSWFKEMGLNYNHNIVTSPQWLSLAHSPIEFRESLNKNKFIASFLNSSMLTSIGEYSKNISKQDTVKKININDYLPEIAEIIFDNSTV
jgi:MoaA/NifB/PqqE/SkfB family radical SAM enzyme